MKDYYIELLPFEKKATKGYGGPDSVCAHFSTEHKPATRPFVKDMTQAIDFYYNQNKRYWNGYVVGHLYVKTGRKEVTCMSPAYSEGHRSQPVYEKVSQWKKVTLAPWQIQAKGVPCSKMNEEMKLVNDNGTWKIKWNDGFERSFESFFKAKLHFVALVNQQIAMER